VAGETEYAFWHVLTRDVAYEQIPTAARSVKHLTAARWIAELAGDRVADHAEFVAYHYLEAFRLRPTDDTVLGPNPDEAVTFLLLAGDRTLPLDLVRAERWYREALALSADASIERYRALERLGEAMLLDGRLSDAERALTEAADGFRAHGALVEAGDAMSRLSRVVWTKGQGQQAADTLEKAIDLLQGAAPGPELAGAYTEMAGRRLTAGNYGECVAWSERALVLAQELGLPEQTVLALARRGAARALQGDAQGIVDLERAVELARDAGLGRAAWLAHHNLAVMIQQYRDLPSAHEAYEAGIEVAERRGLSQLAMSTKADVVEVLYELGRWDEALALADEIIEWDREDSLTGLWSTIVQALVYTHRGEPERAMPLRTSFLARAEELGDLQTLAPALASAAIVDHRAGEHERSVALVEELHERTGGDPVDWILLLPEVLRDLVADGNLDLVGRILPDELEASSVAASHSMVAGRAILAEARTEWDAATALYLEAAGRWERFGHALELANALWGAARSERQLGVDGADAHMKRARELLASLGAASALAAAG
jgi:tetratricopeptide (TPR) repeat protein